MKTRNSNLSMFIALVGLFFLASCSSENENTIPAITPQEFVFELALPDATDRTGLVLDKLVAPLKNIEGVPEWLEVTSESNDEGCPVLWVAFKSIEQVQRRKATITATAENGDKAIVTVFQNGDGPGDAAAGANANEWLTNWEAFETVALNGYDNEQYTPWSPKAQSPADLNMFRNMTKRNGWEMAFSSLNDLHADGRRYFALYNRWLGILRVFCYVKNPGTNPVELAFDVDMGYQNGNRYPFYNALEYAIPTNHSPQNGNLNLYVDLIGKGVTTTFKDLKTPYNRTVSSAMTMGWNVFDIDMTGYVPDDSPWLADGVADRLTINAIGRDKRDITLAGTISANVSGSVTDQEVIQHGGASAQSGVVSALDFIANIAGSVKTAGNYARDKMSSKDFAGKDYYTTADKAYMNFVPYVGYVGIGAKIASGVVDWMYSSSTEIEEEKIPGKIDLTLDGTIDLSGTITGFNSSGDVGMISVNKDDISKVNRDADGDEGHMGSGIISLAEDPVVYVASEDLMANVDHFNTSVQGRGVYVNPDISTNHVRLVSFLDPTSIKLNLNTGLYQHKIENVRISATYGVFLNAPFGSTEKFRRMLNLERPAVDLSMGKSKGLNRFNATSKIRIHQLKDYELLDGVPLDDPETLVNTSVYTHTQGNSKLKYYGRQTNVIGKQFVKSPQVYVPITQDGGNTYMTDGVIPDFVVCIYVLFELDGMPYTFTLHYLPKIKLVGHDELCRVAERLEKFSDDCNYARVVGHLANDPSVEIFFPYGGPELDKTLKMLRQICK